MRLDWSVMLVSAVTFLGSASGITAWSSGPGSSGCLTFQMIKIASSRENKVKNQYSACKVLNVHALKHVSRLHHYLFPNVAKALESLVKARLNIQRSPMRKPF